MDIILSETQQEGTQSVLAKWLKKVGDSVSQHEPIIEISTDKVVMEIAAPCDGRLEAIVVNENQAVQPGQVLGRIQQIVSSVVELSPAVKKLLKDNKLSATDVTGTGRDGRITVEDVERFVRSSKAGAPVVSTEVASHLVKHDHMRLRIAEHMQQSISTAPHVTTVFEANLSAVLKHKQQHVAEFQAKGVKLTLSAYFIIAAVTAIKAVPEVNSRWHSEALEIFDQINIGVATALEDRGLIVPVIKSVEKLDLFSVAAELQKLTEAARDGKLASSAVQGGTFTISNHGVSGSLFAAPIIINQPQSAILGIGKLENRVVVDAETDWQVNQPKFKVQPLLYVTLTIDHRVLDGFKANKFLTAFVDALEKM